MVKMLALLALIGACLYFGWKQVNDPDNVLSGIGKGFSNVAEGKVPGSEPSAPAEPKAEARRKLEPARAGASPSVGLVSGTYRFVRRAVPPPPPNSNGDGAVWVAGSSWLWSLPALEAVQLETLARAYDVPAPTYCVEAVSQVIGHRRGFAVNFSGLVRSVAGASGGTILELGGGGLGLRTTREQLVAALDFSASRGQSSSLASPLLVVDSGAVGEIASGQQVPIPVVTDTQSSSRSSVDYRQTGYSVTVGVVEAEGGVRLSLTQRLGRLGDSVDLPGGGEAPIFIEESAKTEGTIPLGVWVLLGGLGLESSGRELSWVRWSREWESAQAVLWVRVALRK